MPRYTESVEIASPAAQVWAVLATPERWSEGYLETRLRSPDYPGPDSRNDHVYRTRIKEDVAARVIHSDPPRLLEEAQKGRTFSRRVRHRLEPAGERTRVTVEDEISFLGLARLAAPLAARDVRGALAALARAATADRGAGLAVSPRRPRDLQGRSGNPTR
jgi:carbon monoxide dehydrogenase subunit G